MCRSCSAIATAVSDAAAALRHEGNSRRRWCRHDVPCEFAAHAGRSLHLVASLERLRVRTACTCLRPPCSGQVAQKLRTRTITMILLLESSTCRHVMAGDAESATIVLLLLVDSEGAHTEENDCAAFVCFPPTFRFPEPCQFWFHLLVQ